MADKKISQLNSASPLNGNEELPVVQSGTTFKTTINAIKTFFDTIYTTTSAVASQITSALSGYVNTGGLTTNYLPKASDSDTLSNSQIIDDGTNVGVNVTPTARLHVKGSDSTSSNFALHIINSSTTDLLRVRNDEAVIIGDNILLFHNKIGIDNFNPTGNLDISNANDTNNPIRTTSSNTTLTRWVNTNNGAVSTDIQIGNSNGSFYFGVNGSASGYLDNYTGQPFVYKISNVDKITISNTGNLAIANLTASQIVATDASKNLQSLDTATYPSLTELSYVKGLTSAVQTQLNNKKDTVSLYFIINGSSPADSTTYYMSRIAPTTTDTNHAISFPFNGIVKGATISSGLNTISGSNENNTINFRNITQNTSTLISNSVKTNGSATQMVKTVVSGLNISFSSTDDWCLEWVTPAYATNPTTVAWSIYLDIEKS